MLLTLTSNDCDTGEQLATMSKRVTWLTTDQRDACREFGVSEAQALTAYWRAHGHANASTNIQCQWVLKDDSA